MKHPAAVAEVVQETARDGDARGAGADDDGGVMLGLWGLLAVWDYGSNGDGSSRTSGQPLRVEWASSS